MITQRAPASRIDDPLNTSVQFLKGVGPARAEQLANVGILTVTDLLFAFPRRHYDRSRITAIRNVRVGVSETIQGVVDTVRLKRVRRMVILEAGVTDDTGSITAVWFNQPYLREQFKPGQQIILSGKVDFYRGLQIRPAEFEIVSDETYEPIHAKGIIPAYTLPNGFGSKRYRILIRDAVHRFGARVADIFPLEFLKKRRLPPIAEALKAIHFPESVEHLERARTRFIYQELFLMQVVLAMRRRQRQCEKVRAPLEASSDLDHRIRMLFPFQLTPAQERAIEDIRRDLGKDYPMNRLLQGDVGSGKTIVAAYAMLCAVGNHTQAALMAPTEILASQHRNTISKLLERSRVRIGFLGKGQKSSERVALLQEIHQGRIDLVIGTHAMIESQVEFNKLSLVVVDEQHKFGVRQRGALRAKGGAPHSLFMTATPIPRTLSMTLYGDLDISIIDELPPGRRPVKTILKPSSALQDSFDFIRMKIREGCQVYFVYPLIDDSDKLPLKSAIKMAAFLKERYPDFTVALVHGSLPRDEKEAIMASFKSAQVKILVSTLVIEVGIDVPNATVMVVEHAERYGLSQLHQLRGRIARGDREGYFLLFGDPETEQAQERLKTLVETSDGFKVAEKDLALRGPGELLGLHQSGWPEFKIADPARDVQLLGQARKDAQALVTADPDLIGKHHRPLRAAIERSAHKTLQPLSSG